MAAASIRGRRHDGMEWRLHQFVGVGTTVWNGGCINSCYESMTNAQYDVIFNTNTSDWSGHALQYVAGLQYDSGDVPYDRFQINWLSAN
jgi:hypothetical protein